MAPTNRKTTSSTPAVDRRSGVDRRKVDKGPPGGRERRVGIEPRRPEVVEREVSPSEWDSLHEPLPPAPAPKPAE
jgi:hypothetical protein